MFTLSSNYLNELWIIGQVVSLRYYDDHEKLVFTLKNKDGRFCIELCPARAVNNVSHGDQVIVRGSVFSQWTGNKDSMKIRARIIQTLEKGE
jgi:hypothetical protein